MVARQALVRIHLRLSLLWVLRHREGNTAGLQQVQSNTLLVQQFPLGEHVVSVLAWHPPVGGMTEHEARRHRLVPGQGIVKEQLEQLVDANIDPFIGLKDTTNLILHLVGQSHIWIQV